MPLFFYLVLINVLVRIGAAVRKNREPKAPPMCETCSFAHMQYATSGKRAISCTFAGGVRPITIDVMYCTDYRDRSTPRRVALVGFAREAVRSCAKGGPDYPVDPLCRDNSVSPVAKATV
jgi:hypothetical protein